MRIGTSSSALHLAQAAAAGDTLLAADGFDGYEIVEVDGGPEALRQALLAGHCDVAVHAASDIPLADHDDLSVVFLPRESPQDAFVGPTDYRGMPHGARVGVDSANRAAQITHFRQDLRPVDIGGDLEERLARVGELDGIIVSRAELTRLGRDIGQDLPNEVMVPVAGQGAVALEARRGSQVEHTLDLVDDHTTRLEMIAERSFVRELNLAPSAPVGVLARSTGRTVALHARFMGSGKVEIRRSSNNPEKLGHDLAAEFIRRGVRA